MGMWLTFRSMVQFLLTAVRQIPVIAWIPLIIFWSGMGELLVVIVIGLVGIILDWILTHLFGLFLPWKKK